MNSWWFEKCNKNWQENQENYHLWCSFRVHAVISSSMLLMCLFIDCKQLRKISNYSCKRKLTFAFRMEFSHFLKIISIGSRFPRLTTVKNRNKFLESSKLIARILHLYIITLYILWTKFYVLSEMQVVLSPSLHTSCNCNCRSQLIPWCGNPFIKKSRMQWSIELTLTKEVNLSIFWIKPPKSLVTSLSHQANRRYGRNRHNGKLTK